jgi:hypothetical protein
MPRLSKALVCAFVLGFMAGPAVAQEQSDLQKAKEHYTRAEQAMKSGDHALAAEEYGRAYELTKDPVLFYKIASAHYEARNCEAAVAYYSRYLTEGKPDDRFRALTQERIEVCKARNDAAAGDKGEEGQAKAAGAASAAGDASGEPGRESDSESDAQSGSGADQPDPSVATPGLPGAGGDRPPSFADQEVSMYSKAAWVSVGLAATFVTAGAVLGLSASSREEDVRNLIEFRYPNGEPAIYAGTSRERYEDYIDEGERLATYSKIVFVAAGLAAASATAFFILDARAGKDQDTETGAGILPVATPDGLGMAASWRF